MTGKTGLLTYDITYLVVQITARQVLLLGKYSDNTELLHKQHLAILKAEK